MSIREQITRLTGTTSFVCECCGLTYDRDRLNCPACGCDVHERKSGLGSQHNGE